MINFEKNGKKLMEMKDSGEVTVFDQKLVGAGKLKETVEKDDQKEEE